jgi:hypothetical protein
MPWAERLFFTNSQRPDGDLIPPGSRHAFCRVSTIESIRQVKVREPTHAGHADRVMLELRQTTVARWSLHDERIVRCLVSLFASIDYIMQVTRVKDSKKPIASLDKAKAMM